MARSQTKANIIQILRELCDEDFKVLKTSLAEHQRLPKHIPYVQLEKLDRVDTSNKMKKTYGAEKAWNMIMLVLEDIDMGVLEKFQNVEDDSEGEQTSRNRKTEKKKQRSSQKPAPPRRSGSSKVHHDVICEGCEQSIIGTRFKCTLCPDYDLCSDCHSNGRHKKHPMLAMQDPVQAAEMEKAFRQGRSSSSKVHHGVICEGCEESIIGTRFKCTLCPDYDLCSDCQSAGRHKKHPMLAMQVAEMEEAFHQAPSNRASPRGSSSSKVNHAVICEGCEESIIGTRFKCTLCPDYDLCSDCQSAGRHKKHPLLAIQDPAQSAEMEKAFHQEKKDYHHEFEGPNPSVKPAPPCRLDPSKVHHGVFCDGCKGDIIGTRYKCTVCPDYDLCTDCQSTGLHEEHPLLATRPPPKKVHRGVICDGCGGSISGTRFKCTVCPDYDLCTDCQSTGLHEEHPLLATRPPTKKEEEEQERKFQLQFQLLMLEEQALMNQELKQCKALFEYLPKVSDEDELEFNAGDIINIIAKVADEWWLGSVNGKTGIFPTNYVKELDASGKDVGLSDAPGDKEELEASGKDVGLSDAPGDKEGEDSDSGDDDDDGASEDSSEEEPEIPGEDWIPSQWLDIFDDMMGKVLDCKDHWSLSFDERLKLKVSKEEEKKGWTIYGRHASAMFHCCSCSKKWNPGKVVVVFKYRLLSDTRRGTAIMRCFGQACECSPDEFIRPGFSDEEVKKTLCKLFERIQNDDDDDDDNFDEEAVTPHKKNVCEACLERICVN